MSLVENLFLASELVLQPLPLLLMVLGVVIGMSMGAIPGVSATMTVALLVSFTFTMDPVPGLMLLLGIYGSAMYAGSIPAILIRTPGTPAAAATIFDGFPLSEQGQAGRAISIATITSVIGGIIGVLILTLLAPEIADFALRFGSPEFFALAVFGLTIIASVSSTNLTRGLIAGLLGMLLATVGLDPMTAYDRFAFGIPTLSSGINFIVAMIGLFALSEGIMRYLEGIDRSVPDQELRLRNMLPTRSDLRHISGTTAGSSVLGGLLGALPGVGGTIACFVTYNEAHRWWQISKQKISPPWGEGNINGVAAAESGNNASTAGALIPTLTLGIPGDAVSAILIGALLVHGLQPGPGMFEGDPEIVYSIFFGFFVVYLLVLVFGLLGAPLWARVISLPQQYLWPIIFVMTLLGSLAIRGNITDMWIMFVIGVIGYFLRADDYPLAPIVLGMILGPIAETNLRRSLALSDGSLAIFYTKPITLVVLTLSSVLLAYPVVKRMLEVVSVGGE